MKKKIVTKNLTLPSHVAAKGEILAERSTTGNFSALVSELITAEAARRIPDLEHELTGYREQLAALGAHPGSSEDDGNPRDRAQSRDFRLKSQYFETVITDLENALLALRASKYFDPPKPVHIPTHEESNRMADEQRGPLAPSGPKAPRPWIPHSSDEAAQVEMNDSPTQQSRQQASPIEDLRISLKQKIAENKAKKTG